MKDLWYRIWNSKVTSFGGLIGGIGAILVSMTNVPPWAHTLGSALAGFGVLIVGLYSRQHKKGEGIAARDRKKGIPPKIILGALLLILAPGCATQRTLLTETVSADGSYMKVTDIKTRTFWDSKSELAKLKTSSTDKTQSVGLSGLTQESTSTNTVQLLIRVVGAAEAIAAPGPK